MLSKSSGKWGWTPDSSSCCYNRELEDKHRHFECLQKWYKKMTLTQKLLWTLTGRVVISGERFTVTVIAMVSKEGLVIVVFIPVKRLDFEATSLRVSTDDT